MKKLTSEPYIQEKDRIIVASKPKSNRLCQ